MTRAAILALASAMSCAASLAAAQGTPPMVRVTGVVFDSIRGRPIPDAFVSIAGIGGTAATDSFGQFTLDSVALGEHEIDVLSATLDSIGLSGLRARARITGNEPILIATPSLRTLWRRMCGAAPAPDSGILFGRVASLRGVPMAGARVRVSWESIAVDTARTISVHRLGGTAVTDSTGAYTACGVDPQLALRVEAAVGAVSSGSLTAAPDSVPIRRADVVLPAGVTGRATGTLEGVVRDGNGSPIARARIVIDTLAPVFTHDDGRFRVADVPLGSREIEISAIGVTPRDSVVTIDPVDTTRIVVDLVTVVALAPMTVVESAPYARDLAQIEKRALLHWGNTYDSMQLARFSDLTAAMRVFEADKVTRLHPVCATFIDGLQEPARLGSLRPNDIKYVEIKPSFALPGNLRPGNCKYVAFDWIVLYWTKDFFRP